MKLSILFILVLFAAEARGQYRHLPDTVSAPCIDTIYNRIDTIQGQIVYVNEGEILTDRGIQIKGLWYETFEDFKRPIRYELSTTSICFDPATRTHELTWTQGGSPIENKYIIKFIPD